MKLAAPQTYPSQVLDQRGTMVENWISQPAGQSGEFDVLHSVHLVPVADDVSGGGSGNQEGVASKDGTGRYDDRPVWQVVSRFAKLGVIQPSQGDSPVPDGFPRFKIVAQMPVKRQVVFQEQNIIGAAAYTPSQSPQRRLGLTTAKVCSAFAVHLDMDRLGAPVCLR